MEEREGKQFAETFCLSSDGDVTSVLAEERTIRADNANLVAGQHQIAQNMNNIATEGDITESNINKEEGVHSLNKLHQMQKSSDLNNFWQDKIVEPLGQGPMNSTHPPDGETGNM